MKARLCPSLTIALFGVTALVVLVNPLRRGLQGSYYLGSNLSKKPNLITLERRVSLDRYRLEYPGRSGKTSILWKGSLYITQAGMYEFSMTSGPGSKFRIGETVLISGPAEGVENRAAKIELKSGFHPIEILFYQVSGWGQFDIQWAPPGEPLQGLESALLFSDTPRLEGALTIFRIRRIILPLLLGACFIVLASFLTGFGLATGSVERPLQWGFRSRTGIDLLAFLLLNGFVLNVFLSFFSETTVLDFTRFFITSPVHSGEDSWKQISAGLDYLSSPHGRTLYAEVFFARKEKFQYPPTSLLLLMPLRWLPDPKMVEVANFLSWLAIIASGFFLSMIFMRATPRPPGENHWPAREKAVGLIAAFGFTLTFYPLVKSFEVGQIQTWLYFLFVLALWFWLSEKKFLSGVFIGWICLVKPQLGLLALWGLIRGERRFATGIAGTVGVVGLISVALFGWANHGDYLRVLSYIARHGESYYANQSVNGLVNRLLFNGTNLHGNPHAFAPYNNWVYILTASSTAALLAAALIRKRRRVGGTKNEDFLMATVAFTMASPIAWEHHYSILLPVFAAALPSVLGARGRPWMIWLLAVSFVMSANIYPPVNSLANTRFNFLQSHLFFGALALLFILFRLCREPRPATEERGRES